MMNRSPFAVATAAVPPPSAPNFAKDLYIANAARLADEGVVTLSSSTDKNMKEYLSTKGPNKNGYSISEHRVVRSCRADQGHDREGWTVCDPDL